MKHLKQLAYAVVQWRLKLTAFIGIMTGAPVVIVFNAPWFWLISLPLSFVGSMIAEHNKIKAASKK